MFLCVSAKSVLREKRKPILSLCVRIGTWVGSHSRCLIRDIFQKQFPSSPLRMMLNSVYRREGEGERGRERGMQVDWRAWLLAEERCVKQSRHWKALLIFSLPQADPARQHTYTHTHTHAYSHTHRHTHLVVSEVVVQGELQFSEILFFLLLSFLTLSFLNEREHQINNLSATALVSPFTQLLTLHLEITSDHFKTSCK